VFHKKALGVFIFARRLDGQAKNRPSMAGLFKKSMLL